MFLYEPIQNAAADLTIILPPGTVPAVPSAACLPVGDRQKRTGIPSQHRTETPRRLLGVATGLIVAVLPVLVLVIPSAAQTGAVILSGGRNSTRMTRIERISADQTEFDPRKSAASASSAYYLAPGNERRFGTAVDFLSTPAEAAQQAKSASKLLFLLHVSGNFEDPEFT